MKATPRQLVAGVLAALLLAGGAAWLVHATEWAMREVWDPPEGEAAEDRFFLLKRLADGLGAHVQAEQGLAKLPPEGATLLLEAQFWHFLSGNEDALRAWVERGGHLVVFKGVGDDPLLADWVRVRYASPPRPARPAAAASAASDPARRATAGETDDDEDVYDDGEEDDDEDATDRGGPSHRSTTWSERRLKGRCSSVGEPVGGPGWYGEPRRYDVCQANGMFLKPRVAPLWSVEGPLGPHAVRVPVGRGTATLSVDWSAPSRSELLDEDEAALFAAIVQLRPGQVLWLVEDERHAGLLATLWQLAPAACAGTLLALALCLWRWSVRSAPLRAPTELARRSMTEQVRGTAAFLLRHGPAALQRAQRRALDEAAAQHWPGWARLGPAQRVAALARLAEVPPDQLAQACDETAARGPLTHAGRALALMEAARRRVVSSGRGTTPLDPSLPGASQTPSPP